MIAKDTFKLYAVRDKRDKRIERMFCNAKRGVQVELYFDSYREATKAMRLHCTDFNFPLGRYEVVTINCTVEEEEE